MDRLSLREKWDVIQQIPSKARMPRVLYNDLGFRVFCEVGVLKGDNFARYVALEPEKAIAVDTWQDDDEMYETFMATYIEPYDFAKCLRQNSTNAARRFPDHYFDSVFLDAGHTLTDICADIAAWFPKVKMGGVLAGHDYNEVQLSKKRKEMAVKIGVDLFVEKNLFRYFRLLGKGRTFVILKEKLREWYLPKFEWIKT